MSDQLPIWLSRLITEPTSSWKPADWRKAALLMGQHWAELPSGWSPVGMGLLVSGSIIGAVERKVVSHGQRAGRRPTLSRETAARLLEIVENTRLRIAGREAVSIRKVTYKKAVEEIAGLSSDLSGLRKDKKRVIVRAMVNWVKYLKKKTQQG